MQFVYDIETYPNYFCFVAEHAYSDALVRFELSEFRDDSEAFFSFLTDASNQRWEGVGFNNLGFDYPVVHWMIRHRRDCVGVEGARIAYEKANMVINSPDRFAHTLWPDQRFFPQIDLYKLNHFDNFAKRTSLKALEFVMRSDSVVDLPIEPGTFLTAEQAQITGDYCVYDVGQTKKFLERNSAEIEFRRTLVEQFGPEALNWSDVKIGTEYLLRRLPWSMVYYRDESGGRMPRQTPRDKIDVGEILFPYIQFQRRECDDLLERFRNVVITNTKASVSDHCNLDGFDFHFGAGGIHGSIDSQKFVSDDSHVIVDADVTSLYPSIAIVNGLAPEHLGERFTVEYAGLKTERVKHAKGTPRNAALKLGLNGGFGNSNNPWSPLFDPKMTMAITINGQLMLLMLAERLLSVPGLELIQINTDGVTYRVPRGEGEQTAKAICHQWEAETKLDLEFADYAAFWGRDVNNYLALTPEGKIKAKGAYWYPKTDEEYNGWWHRNYSAQIVQRAVQAHLVEGCDIEEYIRAWTDPFDFMLRYKTPRTSRLLLDGGEERGAIEQQRMTRYYVAKGGWELIKESPPADKPWITPGGFKRKSGLTDEEYYKIARTVADGEWDERIHTANKSVYDDRRIVVCQNAMICNEAKDFSFQHVDYDWYIAECRKLVDIFATD